MRPAPFFLLSIVTLTLAAQSVVHVEAPITRVRVHPDEAWITRTGRTQLERGGTYRLEVRELPSGLRLEDLRITAKGPEGSKLGDISVGIDAQRPDERTDIQKNEIQQAAFRQRRDAVETQKEALKDELGFLRKLMDVQASEHREKVSTVPTNPVSLLELGKSLQARLAELLLQDRKLAQELSQLSREELRFKATTQVRESAATKILSKVSIELSAPSAGAVEITLINRTTEARWKPSYEGRLSEDRKRLELVLLASVSQHSLEDWNQVPIELSTTRLQASTPLPRISGAVTIGWNPPEPTVMLSYRVNANVVPEIAPRELPKADFSMAYAGQPGKPLPPPVPALEPVATMLLETKGLATTFLLEGAKSVPSDAQPHRFRVASQESKAIPALVCVPRESASVFHVVRFQVTPGLPFFQGATMVPFANGQRMAEVRLETPRAGQPFELSLGADQNLRAQFDKLDAKSPFRLTKTILRRQRTTEGRLDETQEQVITAGKEGIWTLDELITLSNPTTEPETIEVLDRSIRATNERLKVTLEAKPKPDEASPAPFVRRWTMRVEPNSEAKLQLGLTVRGPKEGTLSGLEESGFVEE